MDSMFTTTPASAQNKKLEDDRKPEENEVYRHRSVQWASPPPECLSLIFEAGLASVFPEEDFDETIMDDDDLCQYILTVTQICRWWRQAALDTPRLWRILILNDKTPLSKLQTWLDRSKAAPICVNLQEDSKVSVHIATKLMPLLLQHINHWGRFIFNTAVPWGLADFLGALDGKEAPLLEELVLFQKQSGDIDVEKPSPIPVRKLFNGPQSVPKLIEVELKCIPLDWSNSPFRNLQALTLAWMYNAEKPRLKQFMTVLRESPQLTHLALAEGAVKPDELNAAFSRNDQIPQPIFLPSLTSLAISDYCTPDTLTLTLRLIHAPKLEELWLTDLGWSEDRLDNVDFSSTIEALGNGILSSFKHLETLEVCQVCCHSKAAWNLFCTRLRCLRNMTLVHPIDLEGSSDICDSLLSALLPCRSETGLTPTSSRMEDSRQVECQNLESLTVAGCSERTVVNLVQQRLEAGYRLAQVIFGANGGPSNEMVTEFSEMGVKLDRLSDYRSDSEKDNDSEVDDGLDL